MDQASGTSCDADVSGLKRLECRDGRKEQVAQLHGLTDGLALCGDALLASELGHRARDGVVEASIERVKVPRTDRDRRFACQFSDGLTHIAVVMHDLLNGEPFKKQITPVLDCGRPNGVRMGYVVFELLYHLTQEHRDAVINFR